MALTLGVNSGFVTVAPTADPAETGTTIDGSSVVTKHTSPAGATKITSIGWYRASGTNAANWEIALYADSAGVAGTRLAVDATNSTTSNGWVVTSVDWAISENTAYWLGLQMDTHSGASSVDGAAAGGAGSDVMTSQTTLADPYGGGAVADSDGMYAIYALVNITHPTSGALTGPGSTVAGTASSATTRATSGTLVGPGSVVTGSADRQDAPVTVTHDTTGALTGPGSTVTGSAARFRAFATSGVLTGAGSTVEGTAVYNAKHDATGSLTGAGSTVEGTSARFRAFDTSGVLTGAGAIIVGEANHSTIVTHDTSGALVGQGSTVDGTAVYNALHDTTGALVGPGSTIEGTAAHHVRHDTAGVLTGAESVVTGDATRFRAFDASGDLVGAGAVIIGAGRHNIPHDTSGALVGPGSAITGAGERIGAVLLSTEHVIMLTDIWQRFGLDATAPLTETLTAAEFGGITLTKSGTDSLTSERSGASDAGDPATMIPDLWLRLGLDAANPMTATATSVTAGTLVQTITPTSNGVVVTRL